jgi:hypothetical protein
VPGQRDYQIGVIVKAGALNSAARTEEAGRIVAEDFKLLLLAAGFYFSLSTSK